MQSMKVLLLSLFAGVFLSACALNPANKSSSPIGSTMATLYDVELYDGRTKQRLSIKQAAKALRDADVVFIGEFHGNHASHWLQAQLQSALHAQRPLQILSMEQFSRDKQIVVDQYLDSEIGERAFLKKANAWPNYKASYRPLVEFAKQHELPIVAANAPADLVRCIGRQGESYMPKLNSQQRKQLADDIFMNNDAYQVAFQKVMHSPSTPSIKTKQKTAMSNSYLAQLSRDNTMAESIIEAMKQYPKYQLIHVNGAFHSDNALGTVALLKQRKPDLRVAVISPVRLDSEEQIKIPYTKGDYVYLLKPQPQQYANEAEQKAAFKSMFSKARSKVCQ